MAGTGPHGRAERRSAGELESEVLATLWATDEALTPADIQGEIGGNLAYNTVHTILKRLYDKGLVLRDVNGRRGAYRPAKNAAELTAEAMHEALDRGPDPIAALQQFVTGLSPQEEEALRDLLGGERDVRIDVYLPLFLPLLLTAVAPQVGLRVSPALAARVLTIAAVLTATASTWALLLLAATLVNEAPHVATEAGEDGRRLPDPVPVAIAVAAITLLWLIAFRLVRALRAHYATRRVLQRMCEGHPPDSELIVAASSTPRAFAIPGTPGRILVTAAMLGALDPAERRVLLAHERAHLAHRHSALSTAVTLAAAANPVLAPVRTTVTFLVERWADEEAARRVGDRRTTARALARAALVAQRARPGCALSFSEHAVIRRIAALQTAPPPNLWPIGVAVLVLGALPALGALDATGDLLRLLGESLPG